MRKAWFRHKAIGFGVTPMSWEGWLCLLALIAAVAATTILLGDPSPAKPASAEGIAQLRAELGLSGVRLTFPTRILLAAAEVVLFLVFARTRTAPDLPPLD
jgi:hypothetical protein